LSDDDDDDDDDDGGGDDESMSEGSANSDDNETDEWADQIRKILENQKGNIHHNPAPVPEHADPFNNEQERQAFQTALEIMCQNNVIPHGYGLNSDEWNDTGYPSFEIIPAGRHCTKKLRISLPDAIWHPRANLWAQAHHALSEIIYLRDL
jgi:hypothetical protein